MQTAQQRISAITNKHLDNNLGLAGMYGLQGSDKAQFDLARNQIKDVLGSIQQGIDPTLALIVRDNDWYWYLAGGLNFAIYGAFLARRGWNGLRRGDGLPERRTGRKGRHGPGDRRGCG